MLLVQEIVGLFKKCANAFDVKIGLCLLSCHETWFKNDKHLPFDEGED